jgi:hypothetical protein
LDVVVGSAGSLHRSFRLAVFVADLSLNLLAYHLHSVQVLIVNCHSFVCASIRLVAVLLNLIFIDSTLATLTQCCVWADRLLLRL